MSEILKEIRLSIHRGAKEVVLLGQTVNSWGLDLTPRKRFSELVEEIASLAGLERIRFTSPHPQEFRSDFISLLERSTKICRHLHLPLQSGSDKILRAMNRNYRVARYLKIVEDLRSKVPDIGLTTDIIVGFPGETISDFEETLAVMRECRFQNSYNFMFSPRPGTVAAELVDDISPDEKLSRVKEVIKLQEELSRVELHNWVEKTAEVMIDGVSGASMNNSQNSDFTESSFLQSNFMYGRSSQNITVNIDRSPLLQDSNLIGVIIPVTIYQATRYSLKAKVA
jgi:tRNA-2-methylthio-N6-dimethylallyladenosine synthase